MRLTWQISSADGTLSRPVSFDVSEEDYEYLEGIYREIDLAPSGHERSVLVNELRTLMDLFACFNGTFLDPPVDEPSDFVPPYFLTVPLEETTFEEPDVALDQHEQLGLT